jgi:hypothetical protein
VRKWCETRPVSTSTTPTPRTGWSFCAWENTRCSFTGSLEVSYGANGKFTTPKVFTGGVDCNNAVFGDPIYGTRKWCETRAVTTSTAPTPRDGWSFCAWENARCSFSGSLEVSYGANGKFTTPKVFTGGVDCNNAVFGDPSPGVRKWCETRPVSTSAPSNTEPPTISGQTIVGKILTASRGTWTGTPTSFAYSWSRCDTNGANCTPITGATSSFYSLIEPDIGRTLRVTVTASNAGGSSFATSAPTAIVQSLT